MNEQLIGNETKIAIPDIDPKQRKKLLNDISHLIHKCGDTIHKVATHKRNGKSVIINKDIPISKGEYFIHGDSYYELAYGELSDEYIVYTFRPVIVDNRSTSKLVTVKYDTDGNLLYDGFNKRRFKDAKRAIKREKEYQKEYYLKVTKKKREKEREEKKKREKEREEKPVQEKTETEYTCTVCGAKFMSKTKRQFCDTCREVRKKEQIQKYRNNPDKQEMIKAANKRSGERRKQRLHTDPEYKKEYYAKMKKWKENRK